MSLPFARPAWRYVTLPRALLASAIIAAGAAGGGRAEDNAAKPIPLSETPHIHGIAVDPNAPTRLFLATPEGLYAATRDGTSTRVSESADDFRGFTVHPADPRLLISSGRAPDGGNLGVIVSRNGGRTWRQLSPGFDGPVNFHAIAISRADSNVIYGLYDGIHVSRDGGMTWRRTGPEPEETIDLAASAVDPDRVYAAAVNGLAVSGDGGATWKAAAYEGRPASMIHISGDGTVYDYILGIGLMSAREPELSWTLLSRDTGVRRIRHFAPDPSNAARLYAVDIDGRVLESADGGRNWQMFPAGDGDGAGR